MMERIVEPVGKAWGVRPKGALGTCGWINNRPWTLSTFPTKEKAEAFAKFMNSQEKKS